MRLLYSHHHWLLFALVGIHWCDDVIGDKYGYQGDEDNNILPLTDTLFMGVPLVAQRSVACVEHQTIERLCDEPQQNCETLEEVEAYIQQQIRMQKDVGCKQQLFICLNPCDGAQPSSGNPEHVVIEVEEEEPWQYIFGCDLNRTECTFTTDSITHGVPLFSFVVVPPPTQAQELVRSSHQNRSPIHFTNKDDNTDYDERYHRRTTNKTSKQIRGTNHHPPQTVTRNTAVKQQRRKVQQWKSSLKKFFKSQTMAPTPAPTIPPTNNNLYPQLYLMNMRFDGNNKVTTMTEDDVSLEERDSATTSTTSTRSSSSRNTGGLVWIDGVPTVTIDRCQFVNATPGVQRGSGLAITQAEVTTLVSTLFIDCGSSSASTKTANENNNGGNDNTSDIIVPTIAGGGLYVQNKKAYDSENKDSSSTARNNGEDEMAGLLEDTITLDLVSFTRCHSELFGGGAFLSGSIVNTLGVGYSQDCFSKNGGGVFIDADFTDSEHWRSGNDVATDCGSAFAIYLGNTLEFKSLHANNVIPNDDGSLPVHAAPVCVKKNPDPRTTMAELLFPASKNQNDAVDYFDQLPIQEALFIDFKSSTGYSPVAATNIPFNRLNIQDSFWCADESRCPYPYALFDGGTGDKNNNDNDPNKKNKERIGFETHETTTTGSNTNRDINTDHPVEFLEETINKTVPLERPDSKKKHGKDKKEKQNEEATMTTTTAATPSSSSTKKPRRRFLGGGGVSDALPKSRIASIRTTLGKSTTATTSFLRRCRRRIVGCRKPATMEDSVTATSTEIAIGRPVFLPPTLADAAAATRSTITTLTTHTCQAWRETTTRLRREYPLDVPSALVGSAVTGIMLLTLSCLRGSSSSSSSSSSSPPRR